ncbi:hypothetical protein AXA59_16455 [Enterobacter hormaechei]|nr:hypothetical protein AM401_00550 [Enterobacter cloacae complex sp.]AXO46210.1 hypothetical protein AXA59_16455 [Enterobacter hormaechei]
MAESENISQYNVFIGYLSIQLSSVYLSVYQWRFVAVFPVVMQTCFLNGTYQEKSFFAFNCSHCSPRQFTNKNH